MVITYQDKLTKGACSFNILLNNGFIEKMLALKLLEFDPEYTNVAKEIISTMIGDYKHSFSPKVKLYRPWNPFSSAMATTYTGNFKLIKLNKRRLNRSWQSISGSIAHEWGHCLEYYINRRYPEYIFNHGNNSPVGKENTFQYWLGVQVKLELMKYGSYDEFAIQVVSGEGALFL